VQSPGAPAKATTNVNLRRSKGYEGFRFVEGRKFCTGPARRPAVGCREEGWEKVEARKPRGFLEFDVAAEKFTGDF